jgi:sugar/nucleoside kinase (ribokinase family)
MKATADLCDLAVVTMGGRGSLLREGAYQVEVPAWQVKPVDTTGAGDMYAAGVLYGLTRGLPLETTGRLASYVAAQVVAKLGPRLDELDMDVVNDIIGG